MDAITEEILRRRGHGLYLSRRCPSLKRLASELMGMHCWFHRNVVFSAAIRGAELSGWRTALTKTWLYRGTLHGAVYDELPLLLALHQDEAPWAWFGLDDREIGRVVERVTALMEDGVCSRAEMRRIFADRYDGETVSRLFSPWGGIFVYLARQGKVAFRSMTSRDFDLISAEPVLTAEEALPQLLRRYFTAYGPATLDDGAYFLGLDREEAKSLRAKGADGLGLEGLCRLERGGRTWYYAQPEEEPGELPRVTLLAGFDPYLVSYANRDALLPKAYRKAVILSSGICLPTVAVDGVVAGTWNLKKGVPTLEWFSAQPRAVQAAGRDLLEDMAWRTAGQL